MSLLSVTTQPVLKILLTHATGTGRSPFTLESGVHIHEYLCHSRKTEHFEDLFSPGLCEKLLPPAKDTSGRSGRTE